MTPNEIADQYRRASAWRPIKLGECCLCGAGQLPDKPAIRERPVRPGPIIITDHMSYSYHLERHNEAMRNYLVEMVEYLADRIDALDKTKAEVINGAD